MYESFYGLSSKPFQLNPDPAFYFGSKQHRRAAAYLEYGIHQNEGVIVVTGEVGAGKTTIVRGLLERLDPEKVLAVTLVSTQLDAEDTLRLVGAAFGIRTRDVPKSDLLMSLEAFLISKNSLGKRCLLIVDEAQNLTARAVEELRMLSNFQYGSQALLQSFLVGQPEFREILQSPQMMQFRQRVIAACHIGPLDVEETRGYIEHRLRTAGATADSLVIQSPAYAAIFKASGGIPRRINSLCDRLLLMGYLNERKDFGVKDVEEVAREIHDETLGQSRIPNQGGAQAVPNQEISAPLGLPSLNTDGMASHDFVNLLSGISAGQFNERLARLERSLLRLERINGTTLTLLQRFISSLPVSIATPHEAEK